MRDGGVRSVFSAAVEGWVALAVRFAPWVVLASLLVAVPLAVFTVRNLGVNTDTADMISEKLPWRQDYLEYKEAFPQYFEEVVIVVEGETPELAAAAGDLATELESEDLIRDVYYPGGGEFFRTNGLLYLPTEDLVDLSDRLATVQPFLGSLARDQTLTGLVEMLDTAMAEVSGGDDVDLTPVFGELTGAFFAAAEGEFHRVSWREMIFEEGDGGGPPLYIRASRLQGRNLIKGYPGVPG